MFGSDGDTIDLWHLRHFKSISYNLDVIALTLTIFIIKEG